MLIYAMPKVSMGSLVVSRTMFRSECILRSWHSNKSRKETWKHERNRVKGKGVVCQRPDLEFLQLLSKIQENKEEKGVGEGKNGDLCIVLIILICQSSDVAFPEKKATWQRPNLKFLRLLSKILANEAKRGKEEGQVMFWASLLVTLVCRYPNIALLRKNVEVVLHSNDNREIVFRNSKFLKQHKFYLLYIAKN